MTMTKAKKDKMTKWLYEFMSTMDPSERNTNYYKEIFDKMSLDQFDKFVKEFLKDDTAQFTMCFQHYENDLEMENIKKAAKFSNDFPLFERVQLRNSKDSTGEAYYTQEEVPIVEIHVKRVEQMASKKNSMSIRINKRSAKTGQVSGSDKNGRVSDMENIALVTMGSEDILREFLCIKADDMVMKRAALQQIANDGYLDMDKIHSSPMNKTALNTLDVFYIGAGIKTDLITDGLLLKRTMKNLNRQKDSLSSKNVKEI